MLDQDLPHAVYNSFCITHRHWPSSEYPRLHLCGQILVSFDLIVVAIVVSASSDSNLDSTREILIETHSSIQICMRTTPCTRISGIIACYSACMGQIPAKHKAFLVVLFLLSKFRLYVVRFTTLHAQAI